MISFLTSCLLNFRAEKNFKKILNNSDDVSDHLQIVSGQIKCQSCGRDNFTSQKEAIEHIKRQHNNVDFEASDSDASVVVDDSSEESEGSSGVESSEMEASDDDDCDNEGKTKSSRRHRLPTTEPQEIKNGRLLISEYVDAIRTKDISSKTVQWTRKM